MNNKMFEKDYLMRLIQTLFDAISSILNCIDKDDIEGAKIQLSNSYKLLGCNEGNFFNASFEELISFFKLKEGNYLKRVQMLAELFFIDATIENNVTIKENKIRKAQALFKHYMQFSNEFSFEISNKLNIIDRELDKF